MWSWFYNLSKEMTFLNNNNKRYPVEIPAVHIKAGKSCAAKDTVGCILG